jgi:hypothetical protein
LNDPTGNLIAAYEVPNYALLVQAAKTGPNHDALALVTAIDKGAISTATWAGHGFNYMQFRTSSGGLEVGSAIVDGQGDVSVTGYWPYGSIGQGTGAFNIGNFDASTFHADPSGTFLTIAENNGTSDYVFGTPNGIFAVDTPNGAILGLKKAASKNFDASFAGTYKAIYYQKTGANTGPNNTETGWLSLRAARSRSATLKELSWLLQLCSLSPTLLTFTARESSAIRVTACLPSAWSPLGSSRMFSSRLWTVRFCSPHSAPHCLGDRGTPTIICTASG